MKNIEKLSFFLVFGIFGVAEASWGLSLAMLARRRHYASNFCTCWRLDGEQERQDGEQERQDEPT